MGLGTSFHGYIKGRQKWKLHKLISVLLVLELDPEAWLADFFSPPVETALPEAKVDLLLDKLEQSSDRMEKVSGSLEGLTEALLKTRSTS
ncbi:MAG: hypothetical protein K0U98_11435 [Deltaproteobacteria bacterium]|nr:hypothetical protein [Deltaproteobacteria bacterium]